MAATALLGFYGAACLAGRDGGEGPGRRFAASLGCRRHEKELYGRWASEWGRACRGSLLAEGSMLRGVWGLRLRLYTYMARGDMEWMWLRGEVPRGLRHRSGM